MDSQAKFDESHLRDLLPLYYKRLFPAAHFYKWLSYGNASTFAHREISFALENDIYLRFQSFDTYKEFVEELYKKNPIKIDIGPIYLTKPKARNMGQALQASAKEMVFDIDLTDYDDVRTCCSGADVCTKCWKFMAIASKIIDTALREDFRYVNVLWVFSGRRGIHAWVSDEHARGLDINGRPAIAEYLTVLKEGMKKKKVSLTGHIHTSISRALKIIDKYFPTIVKEQDILGTDERLKNFLSILDDNVRTQFKDCMTKVTTSAERWEAFERKFMQLQQTNEIPRNLKNLREEIKLQYAYPRLDINVTKGITHLLKAPFCVHPKTGKVCVPFNVKHVDNFDPNNVPTISMIINEVDAYDKKTKEQEETLMETDEPSVTNQVKIKDYKKTSLLRPINLFSEFLKNLEKDTKKRVDPF
ncbi:unnamed protein product [Ceutorhynchus assimilis]|uniref:DNA primase n=1 Tax=Ceutorhynchus assimilis TaxID=467358 RepID=A0A9N9QCQ2_9CUCU|nr:unnamed protein product [Ceutorhynchus assimilis]